jgi:DNA modification methylase
MTRPFWTDGTVTIRHGNALALPQPDASVDLVVTSPPFFGLRSYTDGGEHYDGQIGSEPTPGEFLDALAAATREMARVLKPSGSIFVNLGDKYAQNTERSRNGLSGTLDGGKPLRDAAETVTTPRRSNGVPTKSLMLLPERYRIRCVDDLGLIARAVIVWAKPNGLPESVKDRVRRSHEDWVHLTKEPRYFTGVDEIREPHTATATGRDTSGWQPGPSGNREIGRGQFGEPIRDFATSPLGKLPGSVWTVPTQPLIVPWGYGVQSGRVARYFTDERDALGWLRLGRRAERRRIRALPDHFAAFPLDWPLRLIRGWSPAGICVDCGEGRRPVSERGDLQPTAMGRSLDYQIPRANPDSKRGVAGSLGFVRERLTGYACACDAPTAPTRPAVILDPFAGTGTVGVAARALGRDAELVDLSLDYCRLQRWRVTDPGERARALDAPKPAAQPVAADTLFDLEEER